MKAVDYKRFGVLKAKKLMIGISAQAKALFSLIAFEQKSEV